jgi:hypothetical protein
MLVEEVAVVEMLALLEPLEKAVLEQVVTKQ